jgi:transcriptional regulator with XRE-family HTH domain
MKRSWAMPRQRRWEPNSRLVYERERRGWSQDEAAQEANKIADRRGQPDLVFTGAQFGRWERGESRPRPPLRRVVCELYQASAEALGLLDQGDGAANRRTAIKALTVMGGFGALAGRQLLIDAADAAVAASRKRAQVDPMTLEELDEDVERFALDCLAVSHAELFPQIWDDWERVEQLLDARQSLKDRAHLTLLGGQLTYFLARLSFNLGDYAAARRHAVLAWEYAEDVGQPVLCASVRTLQGTIAYYAGQPQRSLELLRAAEPYETPYTRARIAANTARAYAALSDRPGAELALAAMERQLVDLPVQPGDAPYTPGTAMSALASTLVRLGDGETAEEYARQAVTLHNISEIKDTLFEDRGNATLNLATSLVVRRQPEPEEAAQLGIQAIAVPQEQRTETVRKRAVELCQLLDTWRATPAVKDFTERLRAYQLPASAA